MQGERGLLERKETTQTSNQLTKIKMSKNMKKIAKKAVAVKGGRAIIYVRVSSTEQIAGTSLDDQERQNIKFCKDNGMEVVRIFREEGVSAKTADRNALLDAIQFCKKSKGEINAFVVWKVDRFARNVGDHYSVRNVLAGFGVRLYSATEQIGDSPTERLAETIHAGFAEFDNAIRKMRAINGMRARIKSGIWPFKAPLGYRSLQLRSQGLKKTEPDPIDPIVFPLLQRMLKGFAAEVYTQSDIARELTAANFQELSGSKPTLQLIDRLLDETLPFYAGQLRDTFDDVAVYYPGRHVPMITEAEMNKIILIRNGKTQSSTVRDRYNPTFPLRRTIKCSVCGHGLTGSSPKGRKQHYAYYHCFTKDCPMRNKGLGKTDVEEDFKSLVSSLTPNAKFLDCLVEALQAYWSEQLGTYIASQTSLKTELAQLEAKKAKVYELAENGIYLPVQAQERLRAIDMDITRVQLALNGMSVDSFDLSNATDQARAAINEIMSNMLDLDPATRYRFQKVIFPEGIQYSKSGGFGTTKTARIFGLNREFTSTNSLKVRRVGFEPTKAEADRFTACCN